MANVLSYLQKALEIKVAFVIVGGAIIVATIQVFRDQLSLMLAGIGLGVFFAIAVPLAIWLWAWRNRVRPFAMAIPMYESPLRESIVRNAVQFSEPAISVHGNRLTGRHAIVSGVVGNPTDVILDQLQSKFVISDLDSARNHFHVFTMADLAPKEKDSYRFKLKLGRREDRLKIVWIIERQHVEIARCHIPV